MSYDTFRPHADRVYRIMKKDIDGRGRIRWQSALPGFVLDFGKFKKHRWLEMKEDIKRSVERTDVARELTFEYGL